MSKSAQDWTSIAAMLACNAARFGPRPAILGGGGVQLSHRELQGQVAAMVQALRAAGVGRRDRIAIALPPGPDAAVAFLAAAACATAAPLNPAHPESEFALQLRALPATVLLLARGGESPARAAAHSSGVAVMELDPLCSATASAAGAAELAAPEDVALVLHTSGTTSRPKKVPLSHANLCASARSIAATMQLRPEDISLCAMPLFHIHGLACLLAALGAGGSCVCVGSFKADQFSRWLESWKPTWFSAVPTMLQALLDAAPGPAAAASSLRFMRSSSAPLPPSLMAGLEKAFGVPVIESYGMTEAAHQMASNPLPPRLRKPGSVGVACGPQVAIMDQCGSMLEPGAIGEVVIMGPNVMCGYEDNAAANASAFHAGWFRTGDQGYFDQQGYLFITGRLKELINRGGEKIVPREIDEALLAHPAVRQAVAFATPHPSLGEDVAAAVVLKTEGSCTEAQLRAFLLDRLPAFKVPSRVILVDELPKGPTGKIQRVGMAERLAPALSLAYQVPQSDTERLVADTIVVVLGLARVGREDNFFALGGDSLRATQVLMRLQQALTLELPVTLLFRLPTPALLGARLDEMVAGREIDQLACALAALPPNEQATLLEEVRLPGS